MFNKELKERFLSDKLESTAKNYRYILEKAEVLENQKMKFTNDEVSADLCNFTKAECESLIKRYNNRSKNVVDVIFSCLRQYVDFCVNEGLVEDRINYFSTTGGKEIEKYIDQNATRKKYITFEQLADIERLCINEQDVVTPWLLFLGVKGEQLIEILNLKFDEQIKEDKIILSNREIPISKQSYEIIKKAYEETKYYRGNVYSSEKGHDLYPSEFVLHPTISSKNEKGEEEDGESQNGEPQLSYSGLIQRLNRVKRYFENDYLNSTNIWISGQIHLGMKLKEEKNELSKEDIQYICHIFDIEQTPNNLVKVRNRVENFIKQHSEDSEEEP